MARKETKLTQAQKAKMYDLHQQWQKLADSMKLLKKDSEGYNALKKERNVITEQKKNLRESSN
jgi:Spy/CpxP family protein refolding chaperone